MAVEPRAEGVSVKYQCGHRTITFATMEEIPEMCPMCDKPIEGYFGNFSIAGPTHPRPMAVIKISE